VTCPLSALQELELDLRDLLKGSNVSEFKWTKLDGAKDRFAANKMCDFAVNHARMHKLRVDVLIWDIQDSRHNIRGRDDIANLQRMYYHLFRNVLRARWPNDAVWRLHPDEHTAMNWETVKDCLENVSKRVETECSLLTGGQFRVRLQREFGIEEIQQVSSATHPLVQLADLFTGLAVFSREMFDEYQKWLQYTSPQAHLFEESQTSKNLSQRRCERFQVLNSFYSCCKQWKLGVSLATKRGLWTPDPKNPLNFWLYEPQHEDDKAPVK
jgi:hypothetical protein